MKKEFGERFLAMLLLDAKNNKTGWLLKFKKEPIDADHLRISSLLIIFQDQVSLFERNGVGFGFAHHGFFQVNFEDRAFQVEQGKLLHQRTGVDPIGFAIGPEAGYDKGQRIFALFLGRTTFSPNDDLRPSHFLPEPEAAPIQHPANILANIRKNQTRFNNKVNSLLSILGDGSINSSQNNQAYPVPEWIIGMLNDQQKKFWQAILVHQGNGRSAHFNITDLINWKNEIARSISLSDADASMQLDLFIRIGLIIKGAKPE